MPKKKRQRQKAGHLAQQQRRAQMRARQRTRRRWSLAAAFIAVTLVAGLVISLAGDPGRDVTSGTTTVPPTTVATADGRPVVPLPQPPPGATITGDTPCPPADGSARRTTTFAKPPPMCITATKTYVADIQTSKGLITVALDARAAPKTVNNFVVLARYHFYDGIPFHRIIPGFVVQGGDPKLAPEAVGSGGPGYRLEDELPKAGQYRVGSVAMANSGPNTNGSQFFIISGNEGTQLPPSYSLFGQVTGGLNVVKAIEAVGTPSSPPTQGRPTEVVTMQSVTIKES
ncbi:MAG: peptidylprolyl isomerase [Actinomycetota bacterium]|nr:peptidylprolyl isomerase [Actinomycetota bacterium]